MEVLIVAGALSQHSPTISLDDMKTYPPTHPHPPSHTHTHRERERERRNYALYYKTSRYCRFHPMICSEKSDENLFIAHAVFVPKSNVLQKVIESKTL